MKYYLIFIFLLIIGCENNGNIQSTYIDPQIMFSSRRWWNYDIFISDIYGGHITQITKNKWIDFNPSISRDSKKIAFISDRDGNREIYTGDLNWMDGYSQWRVGNLVNISKTIENEWTPVFSPVDKLIAFSTYFPGDDNYDIFLMDYDGDRKQNITKTSGYEKFPQFSHDGTFLIYQGWIRGKMEIFFTNIIDKNMINITKSYNSNDIISHGNALSPGDNTIVFTSDREGNRNIYLMNINGSNLNQLTSHEANDYEPVYSPDGKSIVFTSERDGNREIYSIEIESRRLTNLTKNSKNDWNPRFYPDGNKIIFQSERDNNWEIYRMDLNGANQTNLTNHPSTDYSFVVIPLINP